MTVLPTALRCAFLLSAMVMAGCRMSTPLPLPDAARAAGLTLEAVPAGLEIRPGSSGSVRFTVRDEAGQPVAYYPLDFGLPPDCGVLASAILSTQRSLTDASGAAVVEVIVGPLANNERPTEFCVEATCPGAIAVRAKIVVTTSTYSVKILPLPAEGLLSYGTVAATQLYFFDSLACADVDVYDIDSAAEQARAPVVVPANDTTVFRGVAPSGVHAVAGLGLDDNAVVRVAGCVDIQGSALVESIPIRAVLLMDRLFPALSGTYAVLSDFQFTPAPPALAAIRSTWQQWARCPFDPARLWLDCTLAALATGASPAANACVPVPGAGGEIGDLLQARRGIPIAPLAGTLATPADTPCRGAVDGDGKPSLEQAIDALFAGERAQVAAMNLGAFPAELAALLSGIHLDSQLRLAPANAANSYWAEHALRNVTFPGLPVVPRNSYGALELGLPVTVASGILATLKADQLSLPVHGFTLRLGTSSRYAFELSSLKSRGATDVGSLVKAVFNLAQWSDGPTVLTGCAALDALACTQIAQSRDCVVDACEAGLETLTDMLADAFASLDGVGLDFQLDGSAPVVYLGADSRTNAPGIPGGTGAVVAGPGLWSASIEARSGSYVAWGSWSASGTSDSQ
ncbi:MAG: hypothetical protein JXP73_02110 [Deltaproteobacteria bacterium]|nr:hypothetical protein [Deltaproteobacteria bacterium]